MYSLLAARTSTSRCLPFTHKLPYTLHFSSPSSHLVNEHAKEESATVWALTHGYFAREEVGEKGRVQLRPKRPLPCPSCGIWIERIGGYFRIRCLVCSLDFCGECAAPYLGSMSVPLRGNAAHHETCHYYKRKVEDRRFRCAGK